MSGIFGFISSQQIPRQSIAKTACRTMAYQGSGGDDIYLQGPVVFAHRHIATLPERVGKRMSSADKRYAATCIGEIHNSAPLREELSAMGFSFYNFSDEELLLCAFSAWGKDCLNYLRGSFAFCVADFQKEYVFLARDQFGMKPMLYRQEPGCFAFCSELPPLARMGCFSSPEVLPASVAQFFRYQYISSPNSIYKNIHKLPPAHAMSVAFDGSIEEIHSYYSFRFTEKHHNFADAVNTADALLHDSVSESLLPEIPVGVLLSGGIDSTLVAACLSRSVNYKISAFTIAFNEQAYSELEYAQKAASHLGLKLYASYLESMALDKLPYILSSYGEPYGDSSVLPTWHVLQLAHKHVSKVLLGDGGDELFGGYHSYANWLAALHTNHLHDAFKAALHLQPRAVLHHLRRLGQNGPRTVEAWHNFIQYYSPDDITTLLLPPYREYAHEIADGFLIWAGKEHEVEPLDFVQSLDIITYMPECLLPKVNMPSTQHGITTRAPLLDTRILAFASSLPESFRYRPGEGGKIILKQLLRQDGFSEEFIYRRKQGFGIPVDQWFYKNEQAWTLLQDLVHAHRQSLAEFLNLEVVERMLKEHSPATPHGNKLWLVLAFACWLHTQ